MPARGRCCTGRSQTHSGGKRCRWWRRCHLAAICRFRVWGLTGSAVLGQVLHGQVTETFRQHALPVLVAPSFSLVNAGLGSRA